MTTAGLAVSAEEADALGLIRSVKMMLVSCPSATWSSNWALSTACSVDGIALVSNRGVSNGLSNNSSSLRAYRASARQPGEQNIR